MTPFSAPSKGTRTDVATNSKTPTKAAEPPCADFVIRNLRRRLWRAFQEGNASLALELYQCTYPEFQEKYFLEAEKEEEKNHKKKLSNAPFKAASLAAYRRSGDATRPGLANHQSFKKSKSLAALLAQMNEEEEEEEHEYYTVSLQSLGNSVSILSRFFHPSEPFCVDDYLSPDDPDSYALPARKSLPMACDKSIQDTAMTSRSPKFRLAFWRSSWSKESNRRHRRPLWDEDLNRHQANAMLAAANNTNTTAHSPLGTETSTSSTRSPSNAQQQQLQSSATKEASQPFFATTPLHEAARLGSFKLLQLLLEQGGADPNVRNGQEQTVLHLIAGGVITATKTKHDAEEIPRIAAPKIPHELMQRFHQKLKQLERAYFGKSKTLAQRFRNSLHLVNSSRGKDKKKATIQTTGNSEKSKKKKKHSHSSVSTKKKKSTVKEKKLASHDRMDAMCLILNRTNPSTGEGVSINAVDRHGRTALHYAAALGRVDVTNVLLSQFGTMLTILDQSSRTPCEWAKQCQHSDLAAQLEARALMFIDPYGVDDDLLEQVQNQQQRRNAMLEDKEKSNKDPRRCQLAAPFGWFETKSNEDIAEIRKERLESARTQILKVIQAWENYSGNSKQSSSASLFSDMQRLLAKAESLGMEGAMNGSFSSVGQKPSQPKSGSLEYSDGTQEGAFEEEEEEEEDGKPNAFSSEQDQWIPGDQDELRALVIDADTSEAYEDSAGDSKPPASEKRNGSSSFCSSEKYDLQDLFSDLQEHHIEKYLEHFEWKVSDALKAFRLGPKMAFEKAGVSLVQVGTKDDVHEQPVDSSAQDRTCSICYEEATSDSWFSMEQCSHGFCKNCLQNYLQNSAALKKPFSSITCPRHDCKSLMTGTEIESLLQEDIESLQRIHSATNEMFVAKAQDFTFCPHPGCHGIVHRVPSKLLARYRIKDSVLNWTGAVCTAVQRSNTRVSHQLIGAFRDEMTPLTYEGIEDPLYRDCRAKRQPWKAHRFCFDCGEDSHWPTSCDQVHEWKAKIQEELGDVEDKGGKEKSYSDLAQKLWIKTNTRPCPKCDVPIEKDDGCNHMTCTNPACRHEFCWICRKAWSLHGSATGGFYKCNIWQEDSGISGRSSDEVNENSLGGSLSLDDQGYGTAIHSAREAYRARREMARFLHHYTRWEAHSESASLEQKMASNVCERMAPVVKAAIEFDGNAEFNFGGKGLSFVHDAFTELSECRSFLKYSYAFSYFRYAGSSNHSIRRFLSLQNRRREKSAFERLQSELEILTEQMSDVVARSNLRASQIQIMFLTAKAAEKRDDLNNLLFSILHGDQKEKALGHPQNSANMFSRDAVVPMAVGATESSMTDLPGSNGRRSAIRSYDSDGTRAHSSTLASMTMEEDMEFVDGSEGVRMWECLTCTYVNTSRGHRCAMCGTSNR